jgi:hypothetical protein
MPSPLTIVTGFTADCHAWANPLAITQDEWAANHGYKIDRVHFLPLYGRHQAWAKLAHLYAQAITPPAGRWLLWLDADVMITAPARPLESYIDLPSVSPYFVIATKDRNGFNSGVFALKTGRPAAAVLLNAWLDKDARRHQYGEQEAISRQLSRDPECVRWVDKTAINAYPADWRPGDLLVHFPGAPDKAAAAAAFISEHQKELSKKWPPPANQSPATSSIGHTSVSHPSSNRAPA